MPEHNYWQEMVKLVASRSKAKRLQVGAIITKEDRIISTGFNGTPMGLDNTCEDENNVTKPEVIHAELNALLFAARHGISTKGATLRVTHTPCRACAGAIIQAGISEVHWDMPYRDNEGPKLLFEAGVTIVPPSTKLGVVK